MWNLTPDYIQQVKEELKGRRAAIEARYADELKGIVADLEEIEQLERIAYAFAVKHLPDPTPEEPVSEPVAEVAELQPLPVDPVSPELEAAPEMRANPKGGLSRWRMRLENNAETESA
ncbi:MAG TPA: hypothetical protein VN808_00250 [Stellaceae bacterium]|nr:hypothetical protein [Stellaceae bacterium]